MPLAMVPLIAACGFLCLGKLISGVLMLIQAAGTTNVEPSVKGRRKAHQGNQGREYWNDKEQDPTDERTDPKGCISLPEERSRAIERLCGRREGQVIGLFGWEFTEAIERPWGRVTSRIASNNKYCNAG
jgi:hypothetical protein